MSTETTAGTKPERPRGTCTGCGFEYTLSVARSGEHKGDPVIRKHNSRTGPGLCDGAQKPPREAVAGDDPTDPAADDGDPGGFVTGTRCTEPSRTAAVRMRLTRLDESANSTEFADPGGPADGRRPAFFAQFDSDGSCGHPITGGDLIRSDGGGGYLCPGCTELGPSPDRPQHTHDDGNGGVWVHDGKQTSCPLPECDGAQKRTEGTADDDPNAAVTPAVAPGGVPEFADPAPMPAELPPVSGQPEPDRDRWGRYLINGQGHTRATSFAKLGSSTFALGEWNERMLVKGLTERPDLLALAHGLDVKQDKKQLNQIADDAQQHAGNKVAANIGTAYHAFTERLDAGLITLADVPEQYRARCEQYVNALRAYGLTTRREWIERTTAVRADQVSAPVPVAGTLDRILQLPNGDLVIGDLKTGSDLSHGWAEIAVQLALYAHGVNTHGLFDWRSKTWSAELWVRTDRAIVMHLPADGDGCTLYRVDLVKGWAYAQVSGAVQSRQKDTSVAGVLVPGSLSVPVPAVPEATQGEMAGAMHVVAATSDPDALAGLYDYAVAAGKFSAAQLDQIKHACRMQWDALNISH